MRLGRGKWVALAFVFVGADVPGFPALWRAVQRGVLARGDLAFISFDNFTLHNIDFVFFELSATKLAVKNTFILGVASATIGTLMALVIAYVTTQAASPAIARSASSPPRRSPFPASCSASACS